MSTCTRIGSPFSVGLAGTYGMARDCGGNTAAARAPGATKDTCTDIAVYMLLAIVYYCNNKLISSDGGRP